MNQNAVAVPSTQSGLVKHDMSVFEGLTKTGDYLDRLQLMTSASDCVKEGNFPANHYALIRDSKMTDLGDEVYAAVLALRPTAKAIGEQIIQSFTPDSELFKDLVAKAEANPTGYIYGPEFLLFVSGANKFCTFMCGSKTARRASQDLIDLVGYTATLSSQLIKGKKHKWVGPQFLECSTVFELPSEEEIEKQRNKFLNEPDSKVEAVEEADTGRER